MFKILELDSQRSAAPTQIGEAFATWDDALAAIKRHLKRFKVSGRNPEGSYWWTRDADGLRKCWISENKEGATGRSACGPQRRAGRTRARPVEVDLTGQGSLTLPPLFRPASEF